LIGFSSVSDSDQRFQYDKMDKTIILAPNKEYDYCLEATRNEESKNLGENNMNVRQETNVGSIDEICTETLFSAPRVIIKDQFDLYKTNKNVNERSSAVINYVVVPKISIMIFY